MRKLYNLLFLLISISIFAQNTVSIKGTVLDSLNNPIEAATVFLSKEKDSTLVEYTVSDVKGFFELKFTKVNAPVIFKTSMVGFKDFSKVFSEGVSQDVDLKKIILQEYGQNLDEVVIVAEAPPIRIKKDTLEFNASSFKVRPDANLEELLKQLPGVQIDENKKITVNGKVVNEILVNGKPFFSEDGQIALENLPSEIINKIQVTDKKTKKERFTKETSKTNDASINITIDEDKNKGYFGRVSAGYGSDDRYESALFLNSFNKRRQVSVVGSANNINANGFSMNDVFDNMRTGRSSGGITESRMLGVNFVENVSDKLNVNGSYNYNFAETENWNKSAITKFLPSGEFTSNSNSSSNSGSEGHRGNVSVDYTGKRDAFYFSPTFNKSHNFSNGVNSQISFDENGELLNESNSKNYSVGDSYSFGSSARYIRNFKREGQFFSIELTNSNSNDDNDVLSESDTKFYQSEAEDDERKQFQKSISIADSYGISVEYSQPITDSLKVSFGANWNRDQSISDLKVYDFNEVTGSYSDLNTLQTNKYNTVKNEVAPFVNIALVKSKFNINLVTQTKIVKNSANALYNENTYSIDKHYIDPNLNAMFNYRISKNDNVFGFYSYNVTYQSANQLLDITDISNPLNTSIGNPDLKPTGTHSLNMSYRSYDFQTRAGYTISASTSIFNNSIVSAVEYDEDRKSISTYKNISGNYQWSLSGDWYRSNKWDEHSLRYGVGVRFNRSLSKGYIDGEMYDATSNTISPRVYFTYDYGDFLSIRPSYTYNHHSNSYTNFSVDKASNFTHRFNVQTTSYWPKNIIFGNDFAYTYNSQIAKGFQRDFYMWNLSLAYEFFDKKFRAKVKVYDVLNQNTSSRRTIDPMQIVDSESLVLKRYAMFSITYKLNEFAGKKGQGRGGMRSMRSMRM